VNLTVFFNGIIFVGLCMMAYTACMYLGAVYHIKKETKRKDLEDEQKS